MTGSNILLHCLGFQCRFGTLVQCGCLGKASGKTSEFSYDLYFFHVLISHKQWATELDKDLSQQLLSCAPPGIEVSSVVFWANTVMDLCCVKVVSGSTMACDDFYEAQGRLDGAFCDYSAEVRFDERNYYCFRVTVLVNNYRTNLLFCNERII